VSDAGRAESGPPDILGELLFICTDCLEWTEALTINWHEALVLNDSSRLPTDHIDDPWRCIDCHEKAMVEFHQMPPPPI